MSSKLFKKALFSALILAATYLVLMFTLLVPYIEENTMALEERVGEVQLQKTVEIIKSAKLEVQAYATLALGKHKESLIRLTSLARQIIEFKERESRGLSETEVLKKQKEALDLISKLTYNSNDYFYISDYNNILIAHPYLRGKDFSNVKDVDGHLIVPPLVEVAKKQGSGFVQYRWKKNKTDSTIYHKLTYAENFKPWKWVICTVVYIDNIDREVAHKKTLLTERLKKLLLHTKIGKNGYIYIFDSHAKMIIHHDKNFEGKDFHKMPNPQTGSMIFDDLINAYHHGDKTLYYLWDAPHDIGHYIYRKVSWIDYDSYFDWYICSSGYLDDFHEHSQALRSRLLYTIPLITIFITILGFYFLRKTLSPIIELSETARKVSEGDLNIRYTGATNNDETAILAKQFNSMLNTIHTQVEMLDIRVKNKTKELSNSLKEKEILLKEIHHRVKNNLFTISSIIGLQEFQDKELSTDEIISSIQHRIQAIAMAHDMLSKDNYEYQSISMPIYIKQLTSTLISSIIDHSKYKLICDIEKIDLPLEQALSIGLIINELVTNAIKYAFEDSNHNIIISMHKSRDGYITLSVRDNGKGFDLSKTRGTGLELVEMSAIQLNGRMDIKIENGTRVDIIFPHENI